ncbi:hypothetical protein Tco_0440087 [Tanacetum coccineum]
METKDTLSSCSDSEEQEMQQMQVKAKESCMVQQFHDTLVQHMESVKKSFDERALHKREYDSRVNEKQMQTKEGKVDTGKALDVSLVVTESSGTKSEKQDTSSRSGNDADVNDADIKPVYDEESMAEVQLTAECNVFVNDQQHARQPELIMKGGLTMMLNNVITYVLCLLN